MDVLTLHDDLHNLLADRDALLDAAKLAVRHLMHTPQPTVEALDAWRALHAAITRAEQRNVHGRLR